MQFINKSWIILAIIALFISGCGGGGGSSTPPPTTKQATIVFTSQSTNLSDTLGGFDLSVTLPVGSSITTDASGAPLTSDIYLSGQFAGSTITPVGITYDATTRTLSIHYPSANSYSLGEFLTVICNVPLTYTPNTTDLSYTTIFYEALTGSVLNTVTATATFN